MITNTNKLALKVLASSRLMEESNIMVVVKIYFFIKECIIMKISLTKEDLVSASKRHADALIVLFNTEQVTVKKTIKQSALQQTLQQVAAVEKKLSDVDNILPLYQATGWAAPKVILVGLGAAEPDSLAEIIAKAVIQCGKDCSSLAVQFTWQPTQQQLSLVLQILEQTTYVYTHTKPSAKANVHKLLIAAPDVGSLRAEFKYAQAVISGVSVAREWGNRPANYATPSLLAEAAQAIVKQANSGVKQKTFTCKVLKQTEIEKLGMGAFLSVARGSDEPMRFIVLRYKGAAPSQAPVVCVGKGVTFDTGGISLKPGLSMDEMKFDMCGAASVLGLFEALRHARPKANVVGLIPSCENMPNGRATKPGDVVTSMSGQTIEVLNTDAEGRLILCDALTYAERFKPNAVIDIATLTGNCVMALGHVRCGLFSPHDELAQVLQTASDTAHDLCWRMPMDAAYGKELRSNFADMANIAGRTAGSISAAKFLQHFTKKYPWAHLDIAGVAWNSGQSKGATGRPVPLLLQFITDLVNQPQQFKQLAIKKQ